MKVNLTELIDEHKKVLDLDLKVDIDSLSYLGEEIPLVGSVIFKGKVYNEAGELYIQGIVEGVGHFSCYRCLKNFEQKIESQIHEKLIKEDSLADEIEESFTIHDNAIDISEILENALILSLPMQIVCDKECKGLCSVCGIDLNKEQCNCKQDEIDPRLAKLKDLLQQD